jgi:hypothetical protein
MSTSTPASRETFALGGGADEHVTAAVAEFRGAGAIVVKSAELEPVSVHPFPARIAAVVLESAGTAPEPS